MINVVWDMETHDPDDFLTLLFLIGHPEIRLKAVTITPGSAAQVGLVRWLLERFELDIPVGAHNLDHPRDCISSWHPRAYGTHPPSRDAEPGGEVLYRMCDAETTLITGAPLKNVGDALKHSDFTLGRWVAQGGFAGEGVVPAEKQLEKFKGMSTCPTFNLNGAPQAALTALYHPGIGERRFVSKNVCHGVVYDEAFHAAYAEHRNASPAHALFYQGMEVFLDKKRGAVRKAKTVVPVGSAAYGKKLHDPLAAACAVDPEIGEWAEVVLYRERGQWGSKLAPGSGTWIIVDYDHARFFEVLTAC